MTANKRCKASKTDGSNCEATALAESDFCFFHDPSKAAERREAQALGGQHNRMRTLDEVVPDVKLENSGDVMALLSETINQVRKGIIDPRVANAIGYLANLQIKSFEQNKLETRIAHLEALLESRPAAESHRQR
jgi:hypothetical protein